MVQVKKRRLWPWLLLLCLVAATIGVAYYFNVSKTLTEEDKTYIRLFLPGIPENAARNASYAEQIRLITLAQQAVSERTRGWAPIPHNHAREPKDLYIGRAGVCYDRSRTLEKMFMFLGMDSRHLALFQREPGVNPLVTLLRHHVPSHAISEVRTLHGWLMVDSNDMWLSIDAKGEPLSVHQMQQLYQSRIPVSWRLKVPVYDNDFYNANCLAVYGLYSRHGHFYPPYSPPIPDYRLRGLLYNFQD